MYERKIPQGCTITNIRRPSGCDQVYATLVDADGTLLISATLEYISTQLAKAMFVTQEEFLSE